MSSAEGKLILRTTRDQGFSRTGDEAGELHGDLPDWEHSVSCPADVANIEEGGSFRAGFNHDFLKTVVEGLKDAGVEIRIHFGAMEILKNPLFTSRRGRIPTLPCSCRCVWIHRCRVMPPGSSPTSRRSPKGRRLDPLVSPARSPMQSSESHQRSSTSRDTLFSSACRIQLFMLNPLSAAD